MKFDDGIPEECPPVDADYPPFKIYRATDNPEIIDEDLISWVKAGRPSANENDCRHWGLSIWMSIEAVEHARGVVPNMNNKFIAEGNMLVGDGRVQATPTKKQPAHCTFWYNSEMDLLPRFVTIMEPEDAK